MDEIKAFFEAERKREITQMRSDKRHLLFMQDEWLDCVDIRHYYDETYETVMHKLGIEELNKAILSLNHSEQLLILLYYYQGWTMEKISSFFEVSQTTILNRHQKIKDKL